MIKVYSRRQLMAKAPEDDWSKYYLIFKVLSAGTITFSASDSSVGKTIMYSTNNGETWSSITSTTEAQSMGDFTVGAKVLVKGNNTAYGTATDKYNSFGGTAKVALCGNIMSLIYGDAFYDKVVITARFAFVYLFVNNANLIDAKYLVLPATSFSKDSTYYGMFQNCSNLKRAPKELPARAAISNMYTSMFQSCGSLVEAPIIQLRSLVNRTCWHMFSGCSSLNYIKAMFTTAPNTSISHNWVYGVAPSGTFVKNSAAEWDVRGIHGIPNNWTIETADE